MSIHTFKEETAGLSSLFEWDVYHAITASAEFTKLAEQAIIKSERDCEKATRLLLDSLRVRGVTKTPSGTEFTYDKLLPTVARLFLGV
jgi:hypothetical protein